MAQASAMPAPRIPAPSGSRPTGDSCPARGVQGGAFLPACQVIEETMPETRQAPVSAGTVEVGRLAPLAGRARSARGSSAPAGHVPQAMLGQLRSPLVDEPRTAGKAAQHPAQGAVRAAASGSKRAGASPPSADRRRRSATRSSMRPAPARVPSIAPRGLAMAGSRHRLLRMRSHPARPVSSARSAPGSSPSRSAAFRSQSRASVAGTWSAGPGSEPSTAVSGTSAGTVASASRVGCRSAVVRPPSRRRPPARTVRAGAVREG